MRYLWALAAFLTAATNYSRSAEVPGKSELVAYENENFGLGTYAFRYAIGDGTYREEVGKVANPESEDAILVVQGTYSFITPDGQKYTVRYTADEKGFRPEISRTASFTATTPPSVRPRLRIDTNALVSLQGGVSG